MIDFLLSLLSKRKTYYTLSIILLGIIVYYFLFIYSLLLTNAFELRTSVINGTFQLFDPLRRIAAGQIPGKDFFFFHGLGTLYIHYPIFALLGKNLLAGEVAKLFVAFTLGFIPTFLFFIATSFPLAIAACITFIFTATCQEIDLGILCSAGNSLLGVRSAMPIITSALMILIFKRYEKKHLPILRILTIFALLNGIAFFMSIEHGLASIVASLFTVTILSPWSLSQKIKELFVYIILLLISITVVFFTVSKGYITENLLYSLQDVTGDQMWYFGAPPNDFLHSFKQLFVERISMNIYQNTYSTTSYLYVVYNIAYATIILLPLMAYRYIKKISRIEAIFIIYLLIYGLISTISIFGILAWQYVTPLARINMFITIYLIVRYLPILFHKIFKRKFTLLNFHKSLILLIATISVTIYLQSYYGFSALNEYIAAPAKLISKDNPFQYKYGVYFENKWDTHYSTITKALGQDTLEGTALQTDSQGWKNGIGTTEQNKHAFIVTRFSDLAKVQPDNVIIFAQSGERIVKAVNDIGAYSIIEVQGDSPLDPAGDGYPNTIQRLQTYDPETYIWSTYSGLTEYTYDIIPKQTDYIIHALGDKKRKEYVDLLHAIKPEYMTTTMPFSFNPYELWLQYTTWDFYEYIIKQYTPVDHTHEQVIWKRNDRNSRVKESEWAHYETTLKQGETFEIPKEKFDELITSIQTDQNYKNMIVMNVTYQTSNPYSFIPFFNKTPRYIIEFENSRNILLMSLPPHKSSITFPIYLQEGEVPSFTPRAYSFFPNIKFDIINVSFKVIHMPSETLDSLSRK